VTTLSNSRQESGRCAVGDRDRRQPRSDDSERDGDGDEECSQEERGQSTVLHHLT
jgi:hypothetical protein